MSWSVRVCVSVLMSPRTCLRVCINRRRIVLSRATHYLIIEQHVTALRSFQKNTKRLKAKTSTGQISSEELRTIDTSFSLVCLPIELSLRSPAGVLAPILCSTTYNFVACFLAAICGCCCFCLLDVRVCFVHRICNNLFHLALVCVPVYKWLVCASESLPDHFRCWRLLLLSK